MSGCLEKFQVSTNLGEGKLDTPDFTLVTETVLAGELGSVFVSWDGCPKASCATQSNFSETELFEEWLDEKQRRSDERFDQQHALGPYTCPCSAPPIPSHLPTRSPPNTSNMKRNTP